MAELRQEFRDVGSDTYAGAGEDVGLKTLLTRLNTDATQLVHDELELAKMEFREVAGALSADVRDAGKTLAKDLAKVGVALSLALMGGLALTAGAILAIGSLLDGAYWAGGLIVGIVLLIAAAMSGRSAATDAKENEALRLENTRRTITRDKQVLANEVRETKDFARHEAQEFRHHASGTPHQHH